MCEQYHDNKVLRSIVTNGPTDPAKYIVLLSFQIPTSAKVNVTGKQKGHRSDVVGL